MIIPIAMKMKAWSVCRKKLRVSHGAAGQKVRNEVEIAINLIIMGKEG